MPTKLELRDFESRVTQVAAQSVIRIEKHNGDVGTGFLFDAGQGLALTAFHCVDRFSMAQFMTVSGKKLDGVIEAGIPDVDLAVIRIENAHAAELHPLRLTPQGLMPTKGSVLGVAGFPVKFGGGKFQARLAKHVGMAHLSQKIQVEAGLGQFKTANSEERLPMTDLMLSQLRSISGFSPGYFGGPVVTAAWEVAGLLSIGTSERLWWPRRYLMGAYSRSAATIRSALDRFEAANATGAGMDLDEASSYLGKPKTELLQQIRSGVLPAILKPADNGWRNWNQWQWVVCPSPRD